MTPVRILAAAAKQQDAPACAEATRTPAQGALAGELDSSIRANVPLRVSYVEACTHITQARAGQNSPERCMFCDCVLVLVDLGAWGRGWPECSCCGGV